LYRGGRLQRKGGKGHNDISKSIRLEVRRGKGEGGEKKGNETYSPSPFLRQWSGERKGRDLEVQSRGKRRRGRKPYSNSNCDEGREEKRRHASGRDVILAFPCKLRREKGKRKEKCSLFYVGSGTESRWSEESRSSTGERKCFLLLASGGGKEVGSQDGPTSSRLKKKKKRGEGGKAH